LSHGESAGGAFLTTATIREEVKPLFPAGGDDIHADADMLA
jgi:hypothetical protein